LFLKQAENSKQKQLFTNLSLARGFFLNFLSALFVAPSFMFVCDDVKDIRGIGGVIQVKVQCADSLMWS
jgi:hypothetical protein